MKGFTLVELLVTISLTMILLGIGIYYSRSIKFANILEENITFLASKIYQARSLALSPKKISGNNPCGFGIYLPPFPPFPKNEFYLFADLAANCENSDHKWSSPAETIEKFTLSPSVEILWRHLVVSGVTSSVSEISILFTPPEPKVYFNGVEATSSSEARMVVVEKVTGRAGVVGVNRMGGIEFIY